MGSADRPRLCPAPRIKYWYLLGNGVQYLGCASGYFRRVAKEADSAPVRAGAQEREFICEALRISYAPYAPPSKRLAPPLMRPGGLASALGIMRALSRMVKDAARVESPVWRIFDARYDYLMKYNVPLSKAVVAPVAPKVASPVSA